MKGKRGEGKGRGREGKGKEEKKGGGGVCLIGVGGIDAPASINLTFYRAMHVVLARYCYRMSSVRPSVRPSVTLRYRGHIGWISSKLVTRIISLGSSLLGRTTSAI